MTNLIKRNSREIFPAIFGWDAFDKAFSDMFSHDALLEAPQGYPTDVIETRGNDGEVTGYEVDVALAGIPKENVEISVEKDTLTISIKKVEKEENETRRYVRNSMARRSMQVKYGLHGIDKNKIKADLSDGMLRVELPLAEEAKPRIIEIG